MSLSLTSLDDRLKKLETKVFGTVTPTPTPPAGDKDRDRYGTRLLNKAKSGGTVYEPPWDNGNSRSVRNGSADPYDKINFINGSGTVIIDGKGTANMTGSAPRFILQARQE